MDHVEKCVKNNRFLVFPCKPNDIYNGADDNASGIIALLEIAKAFQKAKKIGIYQSDL